MRPEGMRSGLAGGAWIGPLLLVANGIVVPVSEELAWRGVIQSSLARAWGMAGTVAVTALALALKHVIVDGSVMRLTSLMVGALELCGVRARWGTGSSTVTHLVANFLATALALATL
jgi:membrane protease YdiL (CAAX protease family)